MRRMASLTLVKKRLFIGCYFSPIVMLGSSEETCVRVDRNLLLLLVYRVVEVAFCCARLSRAVDAFLFLIEFCDVANSSDTYKWLWHAGGRRVGREDIRE